MQARTLEFQLSFNIAPVNITWLSSTIGFVPSSVHIWLHRSASLSSLWKQLMLLLIAHFLRLNALFSTEQLINFEQPNKTRCGFAQLPQHVSHLMPIISVSSDELSQMIIYFTMPAHQPTLDVWDQLVCTPPFPHSHSPTTPLQDSQGSGRLE